MERGALREYIQALSFHTQDQYQDYWDELGPNSLGQAQSPADWYWAIPFIHAQMGSRSLTELRVQRLSTNRRPRSNNVLHTSGTTWRFWMTKLDDTGSLPASGPVSTVAWSNKRINPRHSPVYVWPWVDTLPKDDELALKYVILLR